MTKRTLETQFWIQDVVYLRLRDTRLPGLVCQVTLNPDNVVYRVSWGNGIETCHYDFELSTTYIPDWEHESQAGQIGTDEE